MRRHSLKSVIVCSVRVKTLTEHTTNAVTVSRNTQAVNHGVLKILSASHNPYVPVRTDIFRDSHSVSQTLKVTTRTIRFGELAQRNL